MLWKLLVHRDRRTRMLRLEAKEEAQKGDLQMQWKNVLRYKRRWCWGWGRLNDLIQSLKGSISAFSSHPTPVTHDVPCMVINPLLVTIYTLPLWIYSYADDTQQYPCTTHHLAPFRSPLCPATFSKSSDPQPGRPALRVRVHLLMVRTDHNGQDSFSIATLKLYLKDKLWSFGVCSSVVPWKTD